MILLTIAAHPDDEVDGGGLMCRLSDLGHTVVILFTTRGEGGGAGNPPLCAHEELGAFRESEARASAAILGAKEARFLPFADPGTLNGKLRHVEVPFEEYTAALQNHIAELRPDILLTHGTDGEYGHAQHLYTHSAVFQALENLRPWRPQVVLTWCADCPGGENLLFANPSDPANFIMDAAPYVERKRAAYQAHRTQYPGMLHVCEDRGVQLMSEREECYRVWDASEAAAAEAAAWLAAALGLESRDHHGVDPA
jgi:N-acetylglucosamine malate deacetylase 2